MACAPATGWLSFVALYFSCLTELASVQLWSVESSILMRQRPYEIFIDLFRFLLCEPALASSALDSPSLSDIDARSSSRFCILTCGSFGVSCRCIDAANASGGIIDGRYGHTKQWKISGSFNLSGWNDHMELLRGLEANLGDGYAEKKPS